jgi:hypothetical protein
MLLSPAQLQSIRFRGAEGFGHVPEGLVEL